MGGINQKKIKKLKFHRLKTWQVILVLVPLLFLDATLIRFDHLKMIELRDAVLIADEEEDDDAIVPALEELKAFTFSHIIVNVSESNGSQQIFLGTGPFYLERMYNRAAEDAIAEAEEELSVYGNENVFAIASDICNARGENVNWTRYSQCILKEVEKFPTVDSLTDQIVAKIPSTELYRKNYASPIWAPCPAGFAVLATLILILVIIFRFIAWVFLTVALLFI